MKRLILHNNSLETFSLDGLENLEFLSLENNKITKFPELLNCPNIVNLDLRGNKLNGK